MFPENNPHFSNAYASESVWYSLIWRRTGEWGISTNTLAVDIYNVHSNSRINTASDRPISLSLSLSLSSRQIVTNTATGTRNTTTTPSQTVTVACHVAATHLTCVRHRHSLTH